MKNTFLNWFKNWINSIKTEKHTTEYQTDLSGNYVHNGKGLFTEKIIYEHKKNGVLKIISKKVSPNE